MMLSKVQLHVASDARALIIISNGGTSNKRMVIIFNKRSMIA